jgi:hypothetical protein
VLRNAAIVRHSTVLCSIDLHCSIRYCIIIQFGTIRHNAMQYNTIQYNPTQYNTTQWNTIQSNPKQYSTAQHYNTIRNAPHIYIASHSNTGYRPPTAPLVFGTPPKRPPTPPNGRPQFQTFQKKKKHRFHKKVRFIADVVPKRLLNARFRTTSAVKRTCLWFFFVFFGKSETGGGPPRSPPLCYWESL